jgi:hypothetical protein
LPFTPSYWFKAARALHDALEGKKSRLRPSNSDNKNELNRLTANTHDDEITNTTEIISTFIHPKTQNGQRSQSRAEARPQRKGREEGSFLAIEDRK